MLENRKILVTGGSGFIGLNLVAALLAKNKVKVLDLVPTDAVECIQGNVADASVVREAMKGVDVVVHLAAVASVQKCLDEPSVAKESNVEGTRVVLEQASIAGVKNVVFSSSCAVYGDNAPPLSEGTAAKPLSLYAETKVEGEELCRKFASKGMNVVALRFFNVFGPGQKKDSDYAAVVPIFTDLAKQGRPLTIYGDGKQTRDFVFVGDVVEAIQKAASFSKGFGLFNIGSGTQVTVKELAEKIIALNRPVSPASNPGSRSNPASNPASIVFASPREGEVRYSWADVRQAETVLGFRAKTSLEDGLRKLV